MGACVQPHLRSCTCMRFRTRTCEVSHAHHARSRQDVGPFLGMLGSRSGASLQSVWQFILRCVQGGGGAMNAPRCCLHAHPPHAPHARHDDAHAHVLMRSGSFDTLLGRFRGGSLAYSVGRVVTDLASLFVDVKEVERARQWAAKHGALVDADSFLSAGRVHAASTSAWLTRTAPSLCQWLAGND